MCGVIDNIANMGSGDCVNDKNKGKSDAIEASVALQVLPWVGMNEVYPIVDSVIDYIKSTGVRYHVGPFETTMEGDLDTLLDIVKEAQRIVIAKGAPEVISMVKIAYRPDAMGSATIDSKISKYSNLENDGI